MTHDDIFQALETEFPGEITLVSRYADPALALPGPRAHVFIPDCHLLTPGDAARFPDYHFILDDELDRFLTALTGLKSVHRGELMVWHLGDIVDEWRALGGRGAEAEIDAIAGHYWRVFGKLLQSPPFGVRARLLAGNHDFALSRLDSWAAPRFGLIENASLTDGDVLVLHGDLFSLVEQLVPEDVKAFMVRLARSVTASHTDLGVDQAAAVAEVNRALPLGDAPIGADEPDLEAGKLLQAGGGIEADNVIDGDSDAPANRGFFDHAKELANELGAQGHDIRLVVVGHTHQARIVCGDRGDGVPLVLADCGAWFGTCRLPGDATRIASAQIGVTLGNDIRIYQIGYRVT